MRHLKILFLVFIYVLVSFATAFGQTRPEVANIGDDNQTTNQGPAYTGLISISLSGEYQFETIYLANEINLTADGELTAIEFYVSGGLNLSLLDNAEFYLKTTNQSSLSNGDIDNPADEGYTMVEGSFSTLNLGLSGGDIVRFELDSGFPVEQGDNIAIHTRGGSLLELTAGQNFYATSTGSDNLTKAGSPQLLGLGGWNEMEVTDLRPNARLEFETEFTASANNSVITAQRPQIVADGNSTTLVTLQVRTSTGENVNHGGDSVNFNTSRGSISSANDNGDGTYTATLTSSNSPGTATITATLNGSSVGDNAQVEFVDSLAEMFCTDLTPEEIQIGTPTSDTTPRGPLYNDLVSLTLGTYQFETIFLQNELNVDGPGFLNAIEFLIDADVDVDAIGNAQFYVKETSATSLSDGDVSLDGYTFVGGSGALVSISISGQDRLRLEFETPFFYSGNGNIAIHSRHFILADADIGGRFHYDSANQNLTKASEPLIDILGITAGLTEPQTTTERPIAVFDFEFMTTADLSESSLTADPTLLPADGTSASTITAMIRKADGSVCVLESGAPEFFTTLGDLGSVTDQGDGEYTAPLTSTTPGIATVSAEIDGAQLDDMPEVEFTPVTSPPSPVFTTIDADPEQILANGSSTSEITVTLRDQNDDPITTGGFDVTLSTTAGTLSSVTDNGDGTYNATLTSSTTVETATITGTLEGDAIQDDAQVDFIAVPPTPSPDFTTIEANPTQILADGASTSTITVTLRDQNNDPITTGGFDVTLATTAGTLSSITDNGDGTYNAILTSSTTVETATITGTLEGEDIDDDAEVDFVSDVSPPSPVFTTIDANPEQILADGESTSTITVTLRDENDDLVGMGGFDVILATTAGTLGSVTDNGDGTYTAILTSSTNVETATITGTLEGEDIDDTAEVDFVSDVSPPSPVFTTISANPNMIPADGESTSTITVTLRDENDDLVGMGGFDVTLSTTAGTLSNVTDNGNGTYTAILTSSTNVETAVITGTLEGEDIDDDAEVDFVALQPSPEFTTIDANPEEILADGESTSTITVTLRDENDDLVGMGGFNVTLSTTAGTLGNVTDNGDGTYTAILTSSTNVETATITGTLEGEDIEDDAEVDFVTEVLPPSPEFTTIDANPEEILADGESTSTITVTLRNENNNLVGMGGFDVTLSTTAGTLSNVTDNGNGTYTAILTSSTNVETAVITGTLEGEDIDDDAEVDFVTEVLPPSPEFTTIDANPEEILADGESTSTITVTLRDENNDLIGMGGFDVTLSTTAGTLSNVTDNGDGTYTAILTSSTNEETAVITGTLEGEDIDDTAEVDFVTEVLPPSPEFTTISADPEEILADGESTSTITVTLRNENNNLVGMGGFDVILATTAGTLGNVTDNGDGTYTAILTSSTNVETAVITGTLEGEDIDDTAEVDFVDEMLPPSPLFTTISANPDEIPADGSSTSTITVTLRDGNNNLIGMGGFNVTLSTTAGTLSNVTDNGNGTYTAILTSSTNVETATITGTLDGEDIDDTAEVDFVILPPSPLFTTIDANPEEILADGESTSTITVTLRNENDKLIGMGGFDVTLSTTAGTLGNVTDNGDGTYTAILTSSTNVETAIITGTLEGEDIDDTAEVDFVDELSPPSPLFTTIDADPKQILADGESTSTITVTLRNENDKLIGMGGFDVTLSTTAGTLGNVTDNGDGTYTAILTSSTNVETAIITGTLEGEDIDDTAEVDFVAEILPGTSFTTIEAKPTKIPADGESTSTVTVTLFDENGNRVMAGGFEVILSTTAGTLGDITDHGNGIYTAILTSSETPGIATITGTLEGDQIKDDATVEFTSDGNQPDPNNITIEADPTELPADGVSESIITVTMYNSSGDLITEGGFCSNVELYTTLGSLSSVTDNEDGTCTATLTAPDQPGEAIITGEYNEEAIDDDAIVTFLSLEMFKCEVQTVYPNPFLDNATFRVTSPSAGRITLNLFDILGKKVATVVDEDVTAGEHEFAINGSQFSSGLYIYRYVCPCNCQVDTGRIIHAGRN